MKLERQRDNQSWIFDLMVKETGRTHNFAYGRELPPEVKSYKMIPRIMERYGRHAEELGRAAEKAGHRETALELYTKAMHPYHIGQHSIYEDDHEEKIYLHSRLLASFEGAMRNAEYPIERVEIPFEGKSIQANFHMLPGRPKAPTVLYCPGMDQTKEGYPNPAHNHFMKRGMHVLSIDGPGQGMSNIRKIRVTLDNYERAGKTAIDWLCSRPEVDAERIGVFGCSMGSHWGTQVAAYDPRVKAVATAYACYTSKRLLFDVDSPRFKRIFMYMTGIHDEEAFDRFADQYVLDSYFKRLNCYTLMVHGEYDPLSDMDEAYALYQTIPGPRELWIIENNFHMPVALPHLAGLDVHLCVADWLRDALSGKKPRNLKREVILREKTGSGPYEEQMVDYRLPGRVGKG
jgi:pimeloyl-ACP methyl ester carboxylesterase